MEDDNFRAYLNAQGMSNTYPTQATFPPGLCRRNANQTNFFVPHAATQQFRGMMTSPGAQHDFFADATYHYRDEDALYEEMVQHPLNGQPLSNLAYKPLLPLAPTPQNIALPIDNCNMYNTAPLPGPGVLGSFVDQSQYSPFTDDEWNRASIDYDAPSPDSVDTQNTSPLTPGEEGTNMFNGYTYMSDTYGDRVGAPFIKSEPFADDTVATSFLRKQNELGVVIPMMYSNGAPTAFTRSLYQVPAYQDPSFSVPQHNTFVMPAVVAPHGDNMGPAQIHNNMPLVEANPTFQFEQPNDFSDDDLREVDQTSGAEDDAPALSDSDDHQPVRAPHAGAHAGSAVLVVNQNDQGSKDDYLLGMRARKVSYREIKRSGRYREAESTLRGRFRVLTKDPSERVRKPEWKPRDGPLLSRAVAHFQRELQAEGKPQASVRKIPWKKVSTWMRAHGGSYDFSPATCANKWDELKAPTAPT